MTSYDKRNRVCLAKVIQQTISLHRHLRHLSILVVDVIAPNQYHHCFLKDFTPKKKLMKFGVSGLNLFMILLIRVMMKMKVNWTLEFIGSLVVIWSRLEISLEGF